MQQPIHIALPVIQLRHEMSKNRHEFSRKIQLELNLNWQLIEDLIRAIYLNFNDSQSTNMSRANKKKRIRTLAQAVSVPAGHLSSVQRPFCIKQFLHKNLETEISHSI